MRRHWYRLSFCLLSLLLCVPVTVLADQSIKRDQFPVEVCLPFFKEYLPMIRKSFVILSVTFWACATLMVGMLVMSPAGHSFGFNGRKHSTLELRVERSRIYVFLVIKLVLLVLIVLVNHFFVPEQVLRAQAGGKLSEGQWSFGQIVGMLIWLPVTAEFVFVFSCRLIPLLSFNSERLQTDILMLQLARKRVSMVACRIPLSLFRNPEPDPKIAMSASTLS